MRLALIAALLIGCGGAPASVIDGEWDYALGGVVCRNAATASGVLVIYEGAQGALSGQYDVCGKSTSADDLSGRIVSSRFELSLFGGTVGIVDGHAVGAALSGTVVGLGEGVTFSAVRKGARVGKLPPGEP